MGQEAPWVPVCRIGIWNVRRVHRVKVRSGEGELGGVVEYGETSQMKTNRKGGREQVEAARRRTDIEREG